MATTTMSTTLTVWASQAASCVSVACEACSMSGARTVWPWKPCGKVGWLRRASTYRQLLSRWRRHVSVEATLTAGVAAQRGFSDEHPFWRTRV